MTAPGYPPPPAGTQYQQPPVGGPGGYPAPPPAQPMYSPPVGQAPPPPSPSGPRREADPGKGGVAWMIGLIAGAIALAAASFCLVYFVILG
ncbi:MAG: hypothetical protein LBD77_05965 [Bifidobacteriaceae bacterium]|nr:hypothetical protein [Bifidobacteriaceae bacterium]